MRVLVVAVLKVVVVLAGLWATGQVLARRRAVGDETSDEFAIVAYVGGVERACRATSLRRGSVSVALGGVDLDLREATLAPEGADLSLSASLGGVNVTVPSDWKVVVDRRATLGGVEALVTDPGELPDDAPLLRVEARARLGGVAIMTEAAAAETAAHTGHELRGVATT